jgi:hypothetical protein
MNIDPVIQLAEELRTAEAALTKATQIYNQEGRREDGDLVNLLLARIKRLFGEYFETAPTSALGAAEMVRMAAGHLPFSQARYSSYMHEIADRLARGQRTHTDLVWLRAMQAALMDGLAGKDAGKAARLLALGIAGAARPVMLFRAAEPGPGKLPWKAILASRGQTQDPWLKPFEGSP